jgi:hypothetical protein
MRALNDARVAPGDDVRHDPGCEHDDNADAAQNLSERMRIVGP